MTDSPVAWQRKGMRVVYLVAPNLINGIEAARSRGWVQLAHPRFVYETEEQRVDVRVVSRAAEVIPFGGVTPLVKGPGYEDGVGALVLDTWIKDMGELEKFVDSGKAEWVTL